MCHSGRSAAGAGRLRRRAVPWLAAPFTFLLVLAGLVLAAPTLVAQPRESASRAEVRAGGAAAGAPGATGSDESATKKGGSTAVFHPLLVEKDVPIPMRDGATLYGDVFRPDAEGGFPAIMTLGPYPKDIHFKEWNPEAWETVPEKGPYMHWETVNPEWWVPQGYVVVRVDTRGTGKSKAAGRPQLLSRQEAEDFHDAIEWAAREPWSNGKVAVMGISYFAINAWRVAALDPPHLAAVVPWEGAQDLYGDVNRHGGIWSNTFTQAWSRNTAEHTRDDGGVQEPAAQAAAQELMSEAVRRNNPDLSAIRAPLLSAGNWGGVGLHLRGNIYGFLGAGSEHKMLRVHIGNHVDPFYSMEGRLYQKRFLDYWLKGLHTGIDYEPPIRLAVRHGGDRHRWRYEDEFPLARTEWTPYYLDAAESRLATSPADRESVISYGAEPGADPAKAVLSTAPFAEDVEITGPAKLRVWVSTTADDADLFVIVKNIGPDGREITYPGTNQPELAAAYGWLRVSHRKLDKERSRPWRPVHTHDELERLEPGEVVAAEVEILPSSTVFAKGHRLVLEVAAEDDPRLFPFTHTDPGDRVRRGTVSIHAGGERDSHLLLPVIPPR